MLIATGHVHVEPSDLDEFATDLQALAEASRRRDGNLLYAVAVDDRAAGRLIVVERWRDQASLAAHLQASDTGRFVKRWQGRMRADIRKYDAVNERAVAEE
ncbi:Quinol monooxygenase YgiN [Kaistia soli DSM 19436]|uniref:Quinol monooxygenase YgiN n=1 Tax=Kaistia soli DSM 19436 TaxID=1122133 RepID=A0A1M5NWS4_9HYPH|nr:putative quinol monooxygenase [Kaistia soli]SHG93981.1 Quinol monooxygenase YgiN [Kaistia soli DSM 19436]